MLEVLDFLPRAPSFWEGDSLSLRLGHSELDIPPFGLYPTSLTRSGLFG